MASWIKSKIGSSPGTGSPKKGDQNVPPQTPLEKMLRDVPGPIRNDGSDKYLGMENFGYSCYCNSMLQMLFYTVAFRERVINYPRRSPIESLLKPPESLPRINFGGLASPNAAQPQGALSPIGARPGMGVPAKLAGGPTAMQRVEDKESSEYKKKQIMVKGPMFAVNYDNAPNYGMKESIYTCMKDIFERTVACDSRTGIISPARFWDILRTENETFGTATHQDAHEFFNHLLNKVIEMLEEDAKEDKLHASGGNSPTSDNKHLWINDLFQGTLSNETKCLTCENVSQRDEDFIDMSLDIEEHSSLTSCLRRFSEEEMLCERNKFHCDNCGGLQEAEKRTKIKRSPKILTLHLKRFKWDWNIERHSKLLHKVVYPYYLRLFGTTDDAEDPDKMYELYGVVVHLGAGPQHGHYVAVIKVEDRWILFDDELVEPVDKSYVTNFFGDGKRQACAYVLFYRETTEEAMLREIEAEDMADESAANMPVASKENTGLGLSLTTNGLTPNGIHPLASPPLTPMDDGAMADPLARPIPVAGSNLTPSEQRPSTSQTVTTGIPFGRDDRPRISRTITSPGLAPIESRSPTGPLSPPPLESGAPLTPTSSGTFSRFRRNSKGAMAKKPTFWNSIDLTQRGKDKEKSREVSGENGAPIMAPLLPPSENVSAGPVTDSKAAEKDKEKKRGFGLRRKASAMVKRDRD